MTITPIDLSTESITTGVLRYKDLAYLLTSVNELVAAHVPFSRIYGVDQGKWGSVDVDWLACSATVCHKPNERFLALSQKGSEVYRLGGGESELESFKNAQKGFVRKPGIMREINEIANGYAYAVGTGRQVYRRESENNWICIDQWSHIDSKELTRYSFESIDGFSDMDIYTVGWEGEVWHFNGKVWRQIESLTNLTLHKVKCIDGVVYIVGKGGVILRGRDDSWEYINQSQVTSDIWDIEFYNNKLYLSTIYSLYLLEGEELRLVDFGDIDIPFSCYHLSVADGLLWSIGSEDVLQYDGKSWSRII